MLGDEYMKKIELLAPAGDMHSLYAAVQSGADAIYLGGNKFSARAYANNFNNENLEVAVKYCHIYDVKIYITINTLMKENELKEAVRYTKFLHSIGVDGLIIQDIGFAINIKKILPDFELHASTQMTVHNLEGALFLKEIGFKRIVLSRELSLKEIQYISRNLGVETEIFIHGALCICYSGQCLMSSTIGGRSGNRGRCAQPCRLPYSVVNLQNGVNRKGYILSPKDMCIIENIEDIINTGAASLKIEGRMKRPEYVAGVVSEYRAVIDEYIDSKSKNNNINISERKKRLLQLFNREGFSKAYLFKNTGKDMMSYSFPKNTGVEIGKIEKDMTILLNECISKGDGVRNNKNGFTVSKIIENNRELDHAEKAKRVKLMPIRYKPGDIIYKTSDLNQLKRLENIYRKPYKRKIHLNLKVKFKVGTEFLLETKYKNHVFTFAGEIVESAVKRPVTKDRISENLLKTGDTPFKFSNMEFIDYEEGFLPISEINIARRELINKIEKYVLGKNMPVVNDKYKFDITDIETEVDLPGNIIFVTTNDQLRAALELNFNSICVDPFQRKNSIELDNIESNIDIYIKVPNIIKEEFDYICNFIEKNSNRIKGIITSNLGILNRFKNKINLIGDYKLNIFNSASLKFYNGFTNGNCLSVELSRGEIRNVLNNTKYSAQILMYGKIELMVSEYCAIGSTFGGKTASKNCNSSCEHGEYCIIDRKNIKFPIKTDKFCRSHIYNSVSLNLISDMKEVRNMGIKSFRLDFLDESYEQTKNILKAFISEKWSGDFSEFTRGSYKRGVE